MPGTTNQTKAKPQALKKLQGTYRKDRDGGADSALNKTKPRCPAWLSKDAKAQWKKISKDLYEAGLLRNVDGDALAAYCNAYALWKEATLVVQEKGILIKGKKGIPYQNPALGVANIQSREMVKLLKEFGMTPVSRARLVPDKPEEKELTLAEQIFNTVNS